MRWGWGGQCKSSYFLYSHGRRSAFAVTITASHFACDYDLESFIFFFFFLHFSLSFSFFLAFPFFPSVLSKPVLSVSLSVQIAIKELTHPHSFLFSKNPYSLFTFFFTSFFETESFTLVSPIYVFYTTMLLLERYTPIRLHYTQYPGLFRTEIWPPSSVISPSYVP